MTDCITILRTASQAAELVGACLQADATIHAARIQATAARQAGTMSLIAGLGAAFAVVGAYWSALVQVRLAERQQLARSIAYRTHMLLLLQNAIQEVDSPYSALTANILLRRIDMQQEPITFASCDILSEELSTANFERHALLGCNVQSLLTASTNKIKPQSGV